MHDLYSLKMRGASPKDHKLGGKHISGCEAITTKEYIKNEVSNMIDRALNHNKGESEFINISIQKIHNEDKIHFIDPLNITTLDKKTNDYYPEIILEKLGFNAVNSKKALDILFNLKNLNGALIISLNNFKIFQDKITRCTNMDYHIKIKPSLNEFLENNNFTGKYLKDALCLASKVCNHPNIICELCLSDDKNYTTGYIASKKLGYIRILNFKPKNHNYGGRIFFINDESKLDETINYLKNSTVIIKSLPKIIKE